MIIWTGGRTFSPSGICTSVPQKRMDAKESEHVLQSFRLGPYVIGVVEHRRRWRKHRHVTVSVDEEGTSSEPVMVMCPAHARELADTLVQAAVRADS